MSYAIPDRRTTTEYTMHFQAAGQEPEVPGHGRIRLVIIIGIVEGVFFWQKLMASWHHHVLAILPPMTTRASQERESR